MLAYVALAWSGRFDMRLGDQIASLVYPLDTFSMYAPVPGTQESYLLLRDPQGSVHRVMDFRSFDCPEPLSAMDTRCPRGIQYHHEDFIHYIESHRGPGEREAELITRTWKLEAGAPPMHLSDCVLAHCRVAR
jgi:hypothetical protein